MSYLPIQRPQSQPYGPLQRRLLGLAGLLAVLMIALIVFHALHTGSTGLNAVAEAAERTARQPGAKLAIEVTYTVEGATGQTAPKTVVGEGAGAYNARTGRTSATLTVPVPGKGSLKIDTVGDERQIFMRSPLFGDELPAGKEWLGMEPFLGHSTATAFGSNGSAKSQLELLKTVGDGVEKLDRQTVRGHLATRYKGSVELAKAAQLLAEDGETELAQEFEKTAEKIPAPIPFEMWIDERGLARQIRLIEPLPSTTGGPTVTMDMRMQFFAFGSRPKIKLPSSRKVFDFTPVLRAELGLEDGSTLGPLTPPAAAKPLSVAEFRRRANRICRTGGRRVGSILKGEARLVRRARALDIPATRTPGGRAIISAYGSRVIEPGYRVTRRSLQELAAIDPPPSVAGDYQRYLKGDARSVEWTLVEARLFELGQVKLPSLEARRTEAKSDTTERKKLAAKLGIPVCETTVRSSGSRADTTSS